MQRKVFWATFVALGLTADFTLPILWSLLATIPIGIFSWWVGVTLNQIADQEIGPLEHRVAGFRFEPSPVTILSSV